MRLFNHFYARNLANKQAAKKGSKVHNSSYLHPNDSWTKKYYKKGSTPYMERILFAGKKDVGHGITFFDIDETIFHTFAMIWVMKNGKKVKELNNQQFNTYKLKEGERFDFREFRDAKLFKKTSRIIRPILAKIRAQAKNAARTGSTLALLTARSTFPDMATFKSEFARYGIPIEQMDVNFAGDISGEAGSVAAAKKQIVLGYLENGGYKRVRLIDDNMENLREFLTIAKDVPDAKFTAIHILSDGKTKTIK